MNRMINPANSKARISVIVPKKASFEIRERMHKEGYSLREKSKWYTEAIESLLSLNDYPQYVEMASLVEDFSKTETIYIPSELDEKLNQAIVEVRKEFPSLEGVKSLIVRASIVRRLLAASLISE